MAVHDVPGRLHGRTGRRYVPVPGLPEAEPEVAELAEGTSALFVGNRTFRDDHSNAEIPEEGEAYDGGWHDTQFVLTRHAPSAPVPGVVFVDDLNADIAAAGGKNAGVLGANVARQCLKTEVLDEIVVFIAPFLFGEGVRVFDGPGDSPVRLERVTTASSNPMYHRLRVVS